MGEGAGNRVVYLSIGWYTHIYRSYMYLLRPDGDGREIYRIYSALMIDNLVFQCYY
jgi:hypothetical protein